MYKEKPEGCAPGLGCFGCRYDDCVYDGPIARNELPEDERNTDDGAKWHRTEYLRRKAAGLCVHCGVNPADEGHVLCAECMRVNRERWRRKYGAKDEAARRACGAEKKA